MTIIRSASASDHDAILDVVERAFSDATRDGREEVDIVVDTWRREASPEGLELVAVADDVVVGHVLAALGDLDGSPTLGIAPLSVAPEHQGHGVGSALMQELLRRVGTAGWPLALLLGDSRYYARFGFEPAARFGITYQPVGAGNPHFMVRVFSTFTVRDNAIFTYCWELTGQQ